MGVNNTRSNWKNYTNRDNKLKSNRLTRMNHLGHCASILCDKLCWCSIKYTWYSKRLCFAQPKLPNFNNQISNSL